MKSFLPIGLSVLSVLAGANAFFFPDSVPGLGGQPIIPSLMPFYPADLLAQAFPNGIPSDLSQGAAAGGGSAVVVVTVPAAVVPVIIPASVELDVPAVVITVPGQ
jgi:hypothetical protein